MPGVSFGERAHLGQADQARQALRAAGAGQEAELHLGQAELRLARGRGHAVVAGQRDLQAAAEAAAVDGGDHRLREGLQAVHDRLASARQLGGHMKRAERHRDGSREHGGGSVGMTP